jgi:hypothetical protein
LKQNKEVGAMSDKTVNDKDNVTEKTDVKQDAAEPTTPKRMDYDNLFKTVLHLYFWEALKIFVPELYEAADRNADPDFLEKELQKITLNLQEGQNQADLLVRIKLKDDSQELILCHLEIQGEGGGDLAVRMYRYKEMIHLQHRVEPLGIAILTVPRPHKEKKSYRWERFGVRVAYDYLNVSVIELDDTVLLAENSRIGLVLYAAKCVWRSGNDEGQKFQYLRKITTLWAKRGWKTDDKRIILLAVDYLMKLKDEGYIEKFSAHMKTLKMNVEDREMYVSVFERMYKEEGRKEASAENARNMLRDGMPVEKISQYTNLPREEIEKLLISN